MSSVISARPAVVARTTRFAAPKRMIMARSSERGPGFSTGFVLGGLIFGALGVVFAPQVSHSPLSPPKPRTRDAPALHPPTPPT